MLPHTNLLERNAALRPSEGRARHAAGREPAPSAPQGQAPALFWVLWDVVCPWALCAALRYSLQVAGSHRDRKSVKIWDNLLAALGTAPQRCACTRTFVQKTYLAAPAACCGNGCCFLPAPCWSAEQLTAQSCLASTSCEPQQCLTLIKHTAS